MKLWCGYRPGHTHPGLCPRKLTGARVKSVAKVKDQLLTLVWTWSEKTERMVFVAKNSHRNDLECNIFMAGASPSSPSRRVLPAYWMCPCCAHVTCSSWSTAGLKMKTGEAKGETDPELVCSTQFILNVIQYEWLLRNITQDFVRLYICTFVTLLFNIVCHSLCRFDLKMYELISRKFEGWSRESWFWESWFRESWFLESWSRDTKA